MKTILYTIDCPKCKILETKLNQKKIHYVKITDISVMEQKKYFTLPILEVDDKTMTYREAVKWVNSQEVGD